MKSIKLKLISGLLSVVTCSFISYSAISGPLDPNCPPEKVAKNSVVNSTVGVSGRCTPEKAVERKADGVKDAIGDAKDNVTDSVSDKLNPVKSDEKLTDKALDAVKPDKKEGVVDAKKIAKKVVH